MKRLSQHLLLLGLTLASLLARAAAPSPASTATPLPSRSLVVHFFDVGQGDSALIISPTGKTVLVDGGPTEASAVLAQRLPEFVQAPLDLVILTHPHLDHLGGLERAITSMGAKRFLDSGFDHPSKAYAHLLNFLARTGVQLMTPLVDADKPEELVTIGLGGGAALHILWPRKPQEDFLTGTRSDANSNSIVARLTYGKTAFMFVGDAEPETESHLLRKNLDLTATVLKVGHHGGRYSSTERWLAAIKSKAAVISCAAANDYGHPSPEALSRLTSSGAQVFRTDQHGDVTAVSDGINVTVAAQKLQAGPVVFRGEVGDKPAAANTTAPETAPQEQSYVAAKRSSLFHRSDCAAVSRIAPRNRLVFQNRASAAASRRPAEDCNP